MGAHCFRCGRNINNIDLLVRCGYGFLDARGRPAGVAARLPPGPGQGRAATRTRCNPRPEARLHRRGPEAVSRSARREKNSVRAYDANLVGDREPRRYRKEWLTLRSPVDLVIGEGLKVSALFTAIRHHSILRASPGLNLSGPKTQFHTQTPIHCVCLTTVYSPLSRMNPPSISFPHFKHFGHSFNLLSVISSFLVCCR